MAIPRLAFHYRCEHFNSIIDIHGNKKAYSRCIGTRAAEGRAEIGTVYFITIY